MSGWPAVSVDSAGAVPDVPASGTTRGSPRQTGCVGVDVLEGDGERGSDAEAVRVPDGAGVPVWLPVVLSVGVWLPVPVLLPVLLPVRLSVDVWLPVPVAVLLPVRLSVEATVGVTVAV